MIDFVIDRWDGLLKAGFFAAAAFGSLFFLTTRPAFARRLVGKATPEALAAIRILASGILLVETLRDDLASISLLPPEMRNPAGVIQLLDVLPIGFDRLLASHAGLQALGSLTALFLALAFIGLGTRVFVPLGAVCWFVGGAILRDYTWFFHQGLVPFYLLLVLTWTPCADAFSVDRLIKIYRGRPVPDGGQATERYGWARYACWIAIAVPYVAAGMSKLRNGGWLWWQSDNMKAILLQDTLNPVEFTWDISLRMATAPDIAFTALGLSAVLGEVVYGTVLVSRVARLIVPLMMLSMHIGIVFLQNILFLDLILLQAVFFNFQPLRQAVARLISRGGPAHVLYDGLCPLCRRTVRVLRAFDFFGQLTFVDFRTADIATFNHGEAVSIDPEALEEEMYVVAGGRTYRGFDSYRVLSWRMPAFWPLAPLLYAPGVPQVGRKVYAMVASLRST